MESESQLDFNGLSLGVLFSWIKLVLIPLQPSSQSCWEPIRATPRPAMNQSPGCTLDVFILHLASSDTDGHWSTTGNSYSWTVPASIPRALASAAAVDGCSSPGSTADPVWRPGWKCSWTGGWRSQSSPSCRVLGLQDARAHPSTQHKGSGSRKSHREQRNKAGTLYSSCLSADMRRRQALLFVPEKKVSSVFLCFWCSCNQDPERHRTKTSRDHLLLPRDAAELKSWWGRRGGKEVVEQPNHASFTLIQHFFNQQEYKWAFRKNAGKLTFSRASQKWWIKHIFI